MQVSNETCKELEDFIVDEARCLDERRFDDWEALFANDGFYWVPARPGQENPDDHVSLFYDRKQELATRVVRLRHPQIHVQNPGSRTCHLITNVAVDEQGELPDEFVVRSKLLMVEHRPRHGTRLFAGNCTHHLRRRDDRIEIVMKRVDLIDCDNSFEALVLPI